MRDRVIAEYDLFADIYDIWASTAPVTARNFPFYFKLCRETPGPVAELGVGDGRIAVEVARAGKPIIGVDASSEMLHRCRARAQAAGVLGRLALIQADFRDFRLPEPADLITIPCYYIMDKVKPMVYNRHDDPIMCLLTPSASPLGSEDPLHPALRAPWKDRPPSCGRSHCRKRFAPRAP